MIPVLLRAGGVTVHTYGVMVVIATLVAAAWVVGNQPSRGTSPGDRLELVGVAMVGGLVGARVGLWAAAGGGRPGEWIAFSGGFIQAGVVAGGLAALAYARWRGMRVVASVDQLVPGVPLGVAIGRIGCLAAGCCYGAETSSWARIVYTDPAAQALTGVPLGVPLIPTQVYLGVGSFATFVLLSWMARGSYPPGTLFGSLLLVDGLLRLLVDGLRGEARAVVGSLLPGQLMAAVGMVCGGLILAVVRRLVQSGWRSA